MSEHSAKRVTEARRSVRILLPHAPDLASYDLLYCPGSYWDRPVTALLGTVRTEHHRRMIKRAIVRGTLASLPDEAFAADLPESLHPSFMGGAYLEELQPYELEIARVVLDSTTSDLVSPRARPGGEAILYRMVD